MLEKCTKEKDGVPWNKRPALKSSWIASYKRFPSYKPPPRPQQQLSSVLNTFLVTGQCPSSFCGRRAKRFRYIRVPQPLPWALHSALSASLPLCLPPYSASASGSTFSLGDLNGDKSLRPFRSSSGDPLCGQVRFCCCCCCLYLCLLRSQLAPDGLLLLLLCWYLGNEIKRTQESFVMRERGKRMMKKRDFLYENIFWTDCGGGMKYKDRERESERAALAPPPPPPRSSAHMG